MNSTSVGPAHGGPAPGEAVRGAAAPGGAAHGGVDSGEAAEDEAVQGSLTHSQPQPPDDVCKLLLSHFRKLYLKCCQIIDCLVLITIVF